MPAVLETIGGAVAIAVGLLIPPIGAMELVAMALVGGGTMVVLNSLTSMLRPNNSLANNSVTRTQTFRQAAAYQRVIYGNARSGGTITIFHGRGNE